MNAMETAYSDRIARFKRTSVIAEVGSISTSGNAQSPPNSVLFEFLPSSPMRSRGGAMIVEIARSDLMQV